MRIIRIKMATVCFAIVSLLCPGADSYAFEESEVTTSPAETACGAGCCNDGLESSLWKHDSCWFAGLCSNSDPQVTLGNRLWIGPRFEHRRGNDGAFPVDGDLNGVAIGWRTRNIDATFLSIEAVIHDGAFDPSVGDSSDYEEWQLETLVGHTWSNECRTLFVTPYTGLRYRRATNVLGAPLNLNVEQDVWTAPFGLRTDLLITDKIAVGLDARLQWKFYDDQLVSGVGVAIRDKSDEMLTSRIDAPLTVQVIPNGELELRPYYEWDRFDSDRSSRRTRLDEYGGQISFLYRF
jgi:hypothetical protein